jgi:diguanylate cyclase (GGDEF)-like protein/PAS domain S-box-containing protein
MPDLDPTTTLPTPAAAPAVGRVRLGRSGHHQVRVSMYLAFAAVALAVGVQGLSNVRLEDVRATEAEILDQAGLQRTFSQQIGRVAALLVAEPEARKSHIDAMAQLMERSAQDALQLESLLAKQFARSPETARAVTPALESWQAARERLWYRSAGLLLRASTEGSDEELRRKATAVQAETGPSLAAATQLSARLREASERRAEGLRKELRLGSWALLALLCLLGLVVIEPTARSVRRHTRRLAEQATELQRMAMVAEHTSALVLISDPEDLVVWANPAFSGVSGWPLADATGHRPGELLASPHADESVLVRVQQAVRQGHGVRLEWLHQTRDGHDLWLDVDLRPLRDEQGRLSGFVRVCSDVTGRVQQQAKLQALWAALPAGVLVQAVDGRVVDANRAAERMLGMTLEEMQDRGTDPARWRVFDENGREVTGRGHLAMRTVAGAQALRNETLGIQTPSGETRWLLCNSEPQRDTTGQVTGVVSCFSDITEHRALQKQLRESARTDALTRLPNRAVVMERLQRAVEHARRHAGYGFAVLFMDLDRFKQINDTMGHSAGDELLRQVADRLAIAMRPGDAVARMESQNEVAARLGGDEFVIVLEGVQTAQAVGAIAGRLLQNLAEPYLIDATPVQTSASLGVVLCCDAVGTGEGTAEEVAEEMLRNADTAMYEAKRAGRGGWVLFDNSMQERLVRALEVETDLRKALRDDELFVVYQPVVDMGTRAMVGVEALVRWRHPTRGLVSPVEFIGVAEECGLIEALGATVLRKACTQFMEWQRTPGLAAPAQVAVNLSRAQTEHAGLVDEVRALLQELGMRPEQLQLEITESLAARDERVLATLHALKGLGVRLALDDFGTGYSSLACLHEMPVDIVKIDRSFVKHAETVEYHRVLIEATIRVARTLGISTVAEGIETEGQAELMHTLECDRGQGYLFARPLPADELERWANAQLEAEHADPV